MIDESKLYIFAKSGSKVKPVSKYDSRNNSKEIFWLVERVDSKKLMVVPEKSLQEYVPE